MIGCFKLKRKSNANKMCPFFGCILYNQLLDKKRPLRIYEYFEGLTYVKSICFWKYRYVRVFHLIINTQGKYKYPKSYT